MILNHLKLDWEGGIEHSRMVTDYLWTLNFHTVGQGEDLQLVSRFELVVKDHYVMA